MSKHLDFTRITPGVAVWCKTEEEDIAFRQACEERGILWSDSDKPTEWTSFGKTNGDKLIIEDERLFYNPVYYKTVIPYSDLLVEDKPAKSRLAEILGVEDDEEWEYGSCTYRVHDGKRQYKSNGIWRESDTEWRLWDIIAYPKSIIRKPRFTPDELAMLRCFSAAGVVSIKRHNDANLFFDAGNYGDRIWPSELLPSILPGQSVELAEVLLK